MKNLLLLLIILISISVMICSCGGEDTVQTGDSAATEPLTEPTETAEPTEDDTDGDYDDFIEENFGEHGDDGEYEYKDEVGGKPVTEFGSVGEDGEESFTSPEPDREPDPEPSEGDTQQSDSVPSEPTTAPSEPDKEPDTVPSQSDAPTAPSNEPTEPTAPDTEPSEQPTGPDTTLPSEPVAPKDLYALAIGAIDDYAADVRYKCEVELSDGSVTKYMYNYRVEKNGDIYTATYMEKGAEKKASFNAESGIMNRDGSEKAATLADFYRFCSMVEPIPLKVYFYERSEAGTDFSSKMSAEEHRNMLLNTSPLFTGFDKMDGVNMGKLYFNGHVNADGAYVGSELAFDMDYTEKALGKMIFRVSVEVDYVI